MGHLEGRGEIATSGPRACRTVTSGSAEDTGPHSSIAFADGSAAHLRTDADASQRLDSLETATPYTYQLGMLDKVDGFSHDSRTRIGLRRAYGAIPRSLSAARSGSSIRRLPKEMLWRSSYYPR